MVLIAKRSICACICLLISGCMTHVVPERRVSAPVTVYYADYGVHSSLILPELGKGRYVEYVFGDYGFSVDNKTDPFHTLVALFASGKSAFGRREHFLPPPVSPSPDPPAHKMIAFDVDRLKLATLLVALDARFRSSPGPVRRNAWNNVDYVPDDEHYSVFHSCNNLTLDNLRALGCTAWGIPIIPNFTFSKP